MAMATCQFPAIQGLVCAAPHYCLVHCTCAVAVVLPVYEIYKQSSHNLHSILTDVQVASKLVHDIVVN